MSIKQSGEPNYRLFPSSKVSLVPREEAAGFAGVTEQLARLGAAVRRIAVESYQGVDERELRRLLSGALPDHQLFRSGEVFKKPADVAAMVAPEVTDDPIFGFLTRLQLNDFLDPQPLEEIRRKIAGSSGSLCVYGPGASLLVEDPDLLIYADMPRWEIQRRQRAGSVGNLGMENPGSDPKSLYKQSFFVDWRVLDRHKQRVYPRADLVLDTSKAGEPRLVDGETLRGALAELGRRPFELVPFFDPGVWGGEWMRRTFGLKSSAPNYAWCFNCVPEENSLLLSVGVLQLEIPAQNLVMFQPRELLGDPVHARFGKEFPIRFDFLDTMEGQNLSFQVHPLTEYIQENFGMHYTQDESYYLLDAKRGSVVFLGLKEGVEPDSMIRDLRAGERGEAPFPAERHVESWPARPHDHFLIPAGTPHCSGQDCIVLEISATPYIFTFKLWDWGRLDLDGKPRPINVSRGIPNIQWERTSSWVEANLVNRVESVGEGKGWREERTGLHEREFIETRRHWFTGTVEHDTGGVEKGSVNVLNLVKGEEAIVESPTEAFEPFLVYYAETFIIPAAVGRYTIRPHGASEGSECATIKAYVRH